MKRSWLALLLALSVQPALAQSFDPAPWLADLDQARAAVDAKYANRDWLVRDRGFDLDAAFERTRARLSESASEAEARRIFERLFERFRDGHVAVRWPQAAKPPTEPAPPQPLCARMGYNANYLSPGTADRLGGYRPLPDGPLPAGMIAHEGQRIGIIRIGIFMPQGYPALCEVAARELKIGSDASCDDVCADRLITRAYELLGAALTARIEALKSAGATVLLIDIAGNSGGSEWAEAAARMLTATRLESARRSFVRGPHWTKIWRGVEEPLVNARASASPADRAALDGWIAQVRSAATEAQRNCADNGCPRLASGGYASGLIAASPSDAFSGKPWAVHVFSPSQHSYRDGVWTGPLILLVDQETWSAAEQFAALLQDNRAAVILGARTGGAGCGHTYGGTPTTLSNSKGVLTLPDCARLRRDGSNEVNGVIPDVAVALRADDGPALKTRLIEEKLSEAIARAAALNRR